MDDAALVARALAGDEQAFETLVERHQRTIHAVAERVLRDHDAADEATQRTFVRAFERLRSFRGEASFATWLHRIAMNQCRDILRAERRHVALESVPEERLGVATEPGDVQLGARLRRLIADLPPRQRSVLSLRIFSDLPFAEIARAEGITENSAKVSFHHAVRRLQQWLGRRTP
ncbi:MAG TPA: sigma-70 family RNA polymerase sigma factor [Candidatus Eisenbacteria bacterium]|nr:sigma-70 family RNA polymerase sigma factor [Candidatus Eisenbacteria bacterium]